MRLNYGRTFALGLGFFTVSIIWSIYNSFMPVFYSRYVTSTALIGWIMTIDNFSALTLQPYFGGLSDRTRTRVGRRMPFLLVGVPAAALFFAVIPFVSRSGLASLLAITLLMNLAMSLYRTPVVALMPDITPPPLRSKANGIINFMGGLGALLAFFVGSMLYKTDFRLPFFMAAVVSLAALAVLYATIRERKLALAPTRAPDPGGAAQPSITAALREVLRASDKSALLMLLAILFWFIGYAGIEALFTLYGRNYLGIGEAAASFSLGFLSLAFLVFAIPSGLIATRAGRRRTILAGIALMVAVFILLVFVRQLLFIRAVLVLGGVAWALININSYPMVVEMTTPDRIGTYTGLYYLFSSLAAIGGPPVFGYLVDVFGWGTLFIWSALTFVVAFGCMAAVRGGEARMDERTSG